MLRLGPGVRYLDVGAGSGWPGLFFGRITGCDVTLVDVPLEGLAPSARTRLPRARRRRGRILRGRKRGVARVAVEPLLELGDAGLEPPVRLDQLADPQQQRNRRLPIAAQDRLCLGTLHNDRLRRPQTGPFLVENHKNHLSSPLDPRSLQPDLTQSEGVNAYQKSAICRQVS